MRNPILSILLFGREMLPKRGVCQRAIANSICILKSIVCTDDTAELPFRRHIIVATRSMHCVFISPRRKTSYVAHLFIVVLPISQQQHFFQCIQISANRLGRIISSRFISPRRYNPQIQISEKSQTKRIEIADSRKTKRPKIDKRTTHNKRHSNALITV